MELSNKQMVEKKCGDISYLQFRRLLEYKDKIGHCFTLKGEKNEDYSDGKGENYKKVLESLSLDVKALVKVNGQKHTDIVERVNSKTDTPSLLDGLVTNQKGIALALTFADCTPILYYDPVKNVVGNVHSGWKGTVQKIGQKAVKKMIEEYNSQPQDIICCIGPCIGKCHFEVEEDVKQKFEQAFQESMQVEEWLTKGEIKEGKQKYYIDTTYINKKMLEQIGIKKENIITSDICTVCHSDKIHSYRVEKQNFGRNVAIIGGMGT